ncbi:hypothetical protein BKA93DRAFT_734797 [Sparassis latifolia]
MQCADFKCIFNATSLSKQGSERQKKYRDQNSNYQLREQKRQQSRATDSAYQKVHRLAEINYEKQHVFSPLPPSQQLLTKTIQGFCDDIVRDKLLEARCAVCAMLTPITHLTTSGSEGYPEVHLTSVNEVNIDLDLLEAFDVTHCERKMKNDPIEELKGPNIDSKCIGIYTACVRSLQKEVVPVSALANGLWLGEVPNELQDLSWTEQMLISRVMHNYCVVRVASSGMHKMRANAICHAVPIPKVYSVLPPKCEDLDEVLAFLYTGPAKPTPSDFQRTPFLVRRNRVAAALEWLKLNHLDYTDLEISYKNLEEYLRCTSSYCGLSLCRVK